MRTPPNIRLRLSLESLSQVYPCIKAAKDKGQDEDKGTRKFNIHYSFCIMNNERTSISQGEIVFRSQPHFDMCERTVPIKYLNTKSKDKAGEMEYLHNPILDPPKGTQKEKDNPKKMGQHHAICKNLVKHFLRPFPCGMIQQSTTGWYSFRPSPLPLEAVS
jgi:hypothetical protein